jgi:hypothetical protein
MKIPIIFSVLRNKSNWFKVKIGYVKALLLSTYTNGESSFFSFYLSFFFFLSICHLRRNLDPEKMVVFLIFV